MSYTIKSNNDLMLKLTSAGILMAAAKAKVQNHFNKHYEVFQEMKEDEDAMALFNLYFEENSDELISVAAETLVTSKEAENAFLSWEKLDER